MEQQQRIRSIYAAIHSGSTIAIRLQDGSRFYPYDIEQLVGALTLKSIQLVDADDFSRGGAPHAHHSVGGSGSRGGGGGHYPPAPPPGHRGGGGGGSYHPAPGPRHDHRGGGGGGGGSYPPAPGPRHDHRGGGGGGAASAPVSTVLLASSAETLPRGHPSVSSGTYCGPHPSVGSGHYPPGPRRDHHGAGGGGGYRAPPSGGGGSYPGPPSGGGGSYPGPPSGGGGSYPGPPSGGGGSYPGPPSGGGGSYPGPPSGGGGSYPGPPSGGGGSYPGPPSGGGRGPPRVLRQCRHDAQKPGSCWTRGCTFGHMVDGVLATACRHATTSIGCNPPPNPDGSLRKCKFYHPTARPEGAEDDKDAENEEGDGAESGAAATSTKE